MKEIILIPQLDATDFSSNMEDELCEKEINTHYQNEVFSLDWDEKDDLEITKKWLLEEYGEVIKKYETFAILST